MLTWCSRAVNFSFLSFLAASRTRSSPLSPLSRLGVRPRLGCRVFSLVCDLPSTASASDSSLLFSCFVGNMSQYDSPSPFTRDLPLIAFSLRPTVLPGGRRRGLPVLALEVCLHVWGLRLRGTTAHSRWRAQPCCLLAYRHHGHPDSRDFGAQYPAYRCPCPTLRVRSCGRPRMARGQGGPLLLPCTTLSFATSSRFIPALSDTPRPSPRARSGIGLCNVRVGLRKAGPWDRTILSKCNRCQTFS